VGLGLDHAALGKTTGMYDRPLKIRRAIRRVTVVIVLLLAVFYAEPFWKAMQERFEQTHIQQVLRQITQACEGLMIEAVALDKTHQLTEIVAGNPADCLQDTVLTSWDYEGVYAAPDVLPRGSWGFENERGVLVYRLKYTDRLVNLNPVSDELHFKLRTEFVDVNQNGSKDSDEYITGLLIESVHRYRWHSSTND